MEQLFIDVGLWWTGVRFVFSEYRQPTSVKDIIRALPQLRHVRQCIDTCTDRLLTDEQIFSQ